MCDSHIAKGHSLNASIAAVSKIHPIFGNVAKASINQGADDACPGFECDGREEKADRPKLIAQEHRDAIKKEV